MDLILNTPHALLLPLVVARLMGLLLTAPVLSHEAFPVRLRVLTAIVLALPVVAQGPVAAVPGDVASFLAAAAIELGIGAAMGYAIRLVFAGLEMAGGYIGQQMGVGLIEALNPTMDEAPGTVGTLMGQLAMAIFFIVGGHRLAIGGLMESFRASPVMSIQSAASLLDLMAGLLAGAMALALKVAAPVLVALMLATALLAVVQRSTISFNLFSVGMPLQTMLGLVVLAAAVALAAPLMEQALGTAVNWMNLWLSTNR